MSEDTPLPAGVRRGMMRRLRKLARAARTVGEPVMLVLDDLALSLSMIAIDHGIQVRIVEPDGWEKGVRVHPCVRRVVAHVLEHVVRTALSDATIASAFRHAPESYAIAVSPVSDNVIENNGTVAMAAELLEIGRASCRERV